MSSSTVEGDSLNNFFFVPGPDYLCPGMVFACKPPQACAQDPTTKRVFCCDPGSVCWTGSTPCLSDGSTLSCGDDSAWCCSGTSEICTKGQGQVNICWSKLHDPLLDIGTGTINETFESLAAADPEATSYPFDPNTLVPGAKKTSSSSSSRSSTAQTTSSTSSSTAETTSSSTSTDAAAQTTPTLANPSSTTITQQSSDTPQTSSSDSLSGGAIAGIVIGSIAAIALIAIAVLLFKRQKRNNQVPAYERAALGQLPWKSKPEQEAHELPTGVPTAELHGNDGHWYR